ncbi:putative F-box protein At1g65770 [Cornus florida]|uniref:putative F-box protein At1g65770 n=1 Tax=Cornus florida TaxID=4283 RepID=UPI00289C876F|nr:putative F-box protein At1g65770 [Cornus florida]
MDRFSIMVRKRKRSNAGSINPTRKIMAMPFNPDERRETPMSMSSSENPDWTALPINIVDCILAKLIPLPDYDRFGAVCVAWRHASLHFYNQKKRIQFYLPSHKVPLLLLSRIKNEECHRTLYSFALKKVLFSACYANTRFIDYSQGWLITVDNNTQCLTLINPLVQQKGIINLPPLSHLQRRTSISKVALSADPAQSPHDYLVTVIYDESQRLAFIKSGGQNWTYVSTFGGDWDDVICHKGLIYLTMRSTGEIFSCDTNTNPRHELRIVVTSYNHDYEFHSRCHYFVKSPQGDLLLIRRNFGWCYDGVGEDHWCTTRFEVFKLVLGLTLFVDDYHCICVSASQCEANSIYFTDDRGIFIFNLGRSTIRSLHQPDHQFMSSILSPVWFLPSNIHGS